MFCFYRPGKTLENSSAFVAGFIGVSNFVECDVNGENPAAAVLDIKGECTITCSLKAPFKGKGINFSQAGAAVL